MEMVGRIVSPLLYKYESSFNCMIHLKHPTFFNPVLGI